MEERLSFEKLREEERLRFYINESVENLLHLIQTTRPDIVLGLTKAEATKGGGERISEFGMSSLDLKEQNQKWATNAFEMVGKVWEVGKILANDVASLVKKTKGAETTPEGK